MLGAEIQFIDIRSRSNEQDAVVVRPSGLIHSGDELTPEATEQLVRILVPDEHTQHMAHACAQGVCEIVLSVAHLLADELDPLPGLVANPGATFDPVQHS